MVVNVYAESFNSPVNVYATLSIIRTDLPLDFVKRQMVRAIRGLTDDLQAHLCQAMRVSGTYTGHRQIEPHGATLFGKHFKGVVLVEAHHFFQLHPHFVGIALGRFEGRARSLPAEALTLEAAVQAYAEDCARGYLSPTAISQRSREVELISRLTSIERQPELSAAV